MNPIPEHIATEADLVRTLDELKHRLKARVAAPRPITDEFDRVLNAFIERWGLDGDKHNFATIPEEGIKGPFPGPHAEWQYLVEGHLSPKNVNPQDHLNMRGGNGWELVFYRRPDDGEYIQLIWKRPKEKE